MNSHFRGLASLSQVFYCFQEKEGRGKSILPVLEEHHPIPTNTKAPAVCRVLQAIILPQKQVTRILLKSDEPPSQLLQFPLLKRPRDQAKESQRPSFLWPPTWSCPLLLSPTIPNLLILLQGCFQACPITMGLGLSPLLLPVEILEHQPHSLSSYPELGVHPVADTESEPRVPHQARAEAWAASVPILRCKG